MIHLRKLILAAFAVVALVQSAIAGPLPPGVGVVDLGPAGSVITAGTLIPFTLPAEAVNGGAFHFVFENEGLPMGHIQLVEPTTVSVFIDTLNPQSGTFIGLHLTDMNHEPLPGTVRDVELGFGFTDGQVFTPLVVPPSSPPPILPTDVEPGGYFHDFHLELGPLNALNPAPNNAALVFNQDVITDTWVPEPTSFVALAGLGLVGLLGWRRRR